MAQGGKRNDYFIYDVAINKDSVVVSAWHWQKSAPGSGSAFARDAEDKWIQQAKLKYPDDGYDSFGNSVAIYKNTIVVGAWRSDNAEEDVTNSGVAHIFI